MKPNRFPEFREFRGEKRSLEGRGQGLGFGMNGLRLPVAGGWGRRPKVSVWTVGAPVGANGGDALTIGNSENSPLQDLLAIRSTHGLVEACLLVLTCHPHHSPSLALHLTQN